MLLCQAAAIWIAIISSASTAIHSAGDDAHGSTGSTSFLKKSNHLAHRQPYLNGPAAVWDPQACRSYLSKVYPVAAQSLAQHSDRQVAQLLQGLTLFYEPLPPMRYQVPLQGPEVFGVSCSTKLQNKFLPVVVENGQQREFATVGDLIAHIRQIFDATDFAKPRSSWPAWVRESILEEGAHIEVAHFAGDSKIMPANLTAERFLDSAAWATAWYWARRGSGIFYAAGRSKTAVNKNHMLLVLLREFREKHPEQMTSFQDLFSDMWNSAHAASQVQWTPDTLEGALEATLSGTPCSEVGLPCHNDWMLRDFMDEPMVWLARECGYDTLVFAASTVGINTMATELVDLRLPDKNWLVDWQRRSYQPRPTVAERWVQSMRDEMILSLRDPFNPNRDVGVQACDFDPVNSMQLYCRGALSEGVRFRSFSGCPPT